MIRVHGVGPIYWGVESRDEHLVTSFDKHLLRGSWLVEDLPPYRTSIAAVRLRLGPRALHIGLCRKQPEGPHKELAKYSPTDIGQWGRKPDAQADAEVAGTDEVRSLE